MVTKTVTTGKLGELFVFSELLKMGSLPYLPLVDAEGVDAIVRASDGRLLELQIKTVGSQRSPRWFQVQRLQASERLFIICVEPDHTTWIIPSYAFEKYATKSKGTYDLDLDGTPRGLNAPRKEILAPYRNNWSLLNRNEEDLEDLLAMYESMAAPEEERITLEEYLARKAANV
ncbi:MAG: hypothetical protein HYY02_03765 [Chloroflexi bacterium]|nr:hypothetical protein [Chloroflexota bacterium]